MISNALHCQPYPTQQSIMNSFLQPPVIEDRNGATQQYDSQTSQSIARSFNRLPPSFQLIRKRKILADCNQSNVMHCAKKTKFNSSTSIIKSAVVHAIEDISNTESISTKECNSSTSISKPVAVHASEEISNTESISNEEEDAIIPVTVVYHLRTGRKRMILSVEI